MRVNVITKRNLSILTLCIVMGAMGLGFNLLTRKSSLRYSDIQQHSGIPMAHAADESGCATCHTQPLTGSCTSCHPSPPTTLKNGVTFPHHNPATGGPPDNCASSSCHNAGSDIRYVEEPNASHSYCDACHSSDISHS